MLNPNVAYETVTIAMPICKMRILHIVQGLQAASGVTTFIEGLSHALCARGHQVDCSTIGKPTNLQLDYDVFHIHGLWSPFLHQMARIAKRRRIPVVWSTHGMTAPWSMKHKWWKKCLYWWLVQKRDLMQAAFIHSTVEQEREWNEALGLRRHVVAPLGTWLPELPNVAKAVVCAKTLLFVGRVYPVKALDRLIEAFSRANVVGWKLRIVGPDQAGHMAELKALAGMLKCTAVEFVGPRYDVDLELEYDNCDVLALVSHTENFGATVVDALAHGKPVLTSTNTPWQEVGLRDCGLWVDNDIETLTASLREIFSRVERGDGVTMGARGRALVEEKYTWNAVAKTLERVYRDISQGCEKGICTRCPELYDTCSP